MAGVRGARLAISVVRAARQAAARSRRLREKNLEVASDFEESRGAIIAEALQEALDTMLSMVANNGQEVVYADYIFPAFVRNAAISRLDDGWEEVDVGKYMAFVGLIVQEGNDIMSTAFQEAGDQQALESLVNVQLIL
jgi:hypothetical protein